MFSVGAFPAAWPQWREKGGPGPRVLAAAFDGYADQMTAAPAGHRS